jgi:hypothetical protein
VTSAKPIGPFGILRVARRRNPGKFASSLWIEDSDKIVRAKMFSHSEQWAVSLLEALNPPGTSSDLFLLVSVWGSFSNTLK